MKLVTWNINGIRTFKSGIKKALDGLDADIICVQETKVTRDLLDERTAIVDGYNSYFSYSRGRSGYSGLDNATPSAAEEGLTGLLTNHERAVGCYGDQADFSSEELQLLDNEGRAVITQHKIMSTSINLCCSSASSFQIFLSSLPFLFFSHVIILGDVNTSHRPIDHCDPSDIDDFAENPGRKWLNGFLYGSSQEEEVEPDDEEQDKESAITDCGQMGKFVDMFRYFHPTRTNAFTCWSTLTGARQTNYGTRIDYIFADRRLAQQQFAGADIMPEVEGSDHCPVWARLTCSLLPGSKPPPLCTRYLPEFAGKQQKLSRFLVKVDQKPSQSGPKEALPGSQEEDERRENRNPIHADDVSRKKRSSAPESAAPKGKKSKTTNASLKARGNLLSFFKPKLTDVAQCENTPGTGSPTEDTELVVDAPSQLCASSTTGETERTVKTKQPAPQPLSVGQTGVKKGASSVFWKSVLHGPPPAPCCKVHREPCVLRTVKKEGPNMGKQFFVCGRPQGHASNPEARCNFFMWVEKGKVM
uniref:DNA-(apurinic or apyrimidinic site) endonuclease 2 n=1 Tax=Fundulus heteroclitus TaxID=8078 RepID=A0A3Q2R0P0_FUNHE